jgi:putative ABC transport system permease protein
MMPAGKLARMVLKNTVRSPRHFALSAFGIVFGIGAFVFFLSLAARAQGVLQQVFPIEQVQVIAPRASLLGKDISKKLDDSIVAQLKTHEAVADAVPRMALKFQAAGYGTFEGNPLNFEVGGFADGIEPGFVATDPKLAPLFKDWEAEPPGQACVPRPDPKKEKEKAKAAAAAAAAGSGSGSGSGTGSGSGSGTGSGSGAAPPPAPKWKNTCPNPDYYYCDAIDNRCHRRVPVLVSPTLLEIYSGQFASSHNLPIIDTETAAGFIDLRGPARMSFTIVLGGTALAGLDETIPEEKQRRVEAQLIGINKKAMPIGMTIPIEYVRRWNKEYLGEAAATTYSSIIVTLKDPKQLAPFAQWLRDVPQLQIEDSLGEQFSTVIFVIAVLFTIISVIIITISAINIAHNFFMQVAERRHEIGVMRAVGATPTDVLLLILGEAMLIGIVGGVLGVGLAVGVGSVVDWFSQTALPRFPFKPDSWFTYQPWIIGGGVTLSTLFCVLGGYLPARRASKMEPAAALARN